MHGCKFELIVRIPKLYSCIFQADFPSLRAVGACEPLLEKQNITKQKTLCGVRASELLRCAKFVQVWLIFTNHSDRPAGRTRSRKRFHKLKGRNRSPKNRNVFVFRFRLRLCRLQYRNNDRNKSIAGLGPKHGGML